MPVDDARTLAALDALMARISVAGAAALKGAILIVQRAGMAHSPVLSGTLRRSWRVGGEGNAVYTGPTIVYARRVELGFKGTDRAGRTYDQEPKPYAKPAAERALPAARAFIAQAIAKAIRR